MITEVSQGSRTTRPQSLLHAPSTAPRTSPGPLAGPLWRRGKSWHEARGLLTTLGMACQCPQEVKGQILWSKNHGISGSLSAQDNRLFVRCCLPPLSATPNPEPPCGSRIRRDPRPGFEGTSATQAYQLRVLHSGDRTLIP